MACAQMCEQQNEMFGHMGITRARAICVSSEMGSEVTRKLMNPAIARGDCHIKVELQSVNRVQTR